MSDIYNVGGDMGTETTPPSWNSMCLDDFLKSIADDITGSCMIPMNLPKKEVYNIVQRAKKWFYKNYEYSMRENFYYLPYAIFETEYFKRTRSLTLDKMDPTTGGGEVYSVFGVGQTGSRYGAGTSVKFTTGDFALERMLYGGLYGGTGTVAGAENLQYYVINESYFDLTRQIIESPISYHYNQLTHEIRFTGLNPKKDVILNVYETVPECALFEDEAFFRYVSAKVKISLGNKMSIFDYTLPGGIKVNAEAIQSLGQDELDKVIEEIKTDEGTDWMMHS
jgi:hypothetical protein